MAYIGLALIISTIIFTTIYGVGEESTVPYLVIAIVLYAFIGINKE